jgi:hypothetical protein
VAWARKLDTTGLPQLYEDDNREPAVGVVSPAAIHHVRIKTEDRFFIPGLGEIAMTLDGYSQVVVGQVRNSEWGQAILYVNYTEHKMFGHHPATGDVMVELNPNVLSGGNIFPAPENRQSGQRNMACRVNIGALFHVEALSTTLFNKTPIQIASDTLRRIPPLGEGGVANVFSLPLYRVSDPDGELVGYIESLDYHVLGYAPRDLVVRYRSARSFKQFRELTGIHRL